MKLIHLLAATLLYASCSAPQIVKKDSVNPCPRIERVVATDVTKNFGITVMYNKALEDVTESCPRYDLGVADLVSRDNNDQYRVMFHFEKEAGKTLFVSVTGPFQDMFRDESPRVRCDIEGMEMSCSLDAIFDPRNIQRTINNPFKYKPGMIKQKYQNPCHVLHSGKFKDRYTARLTLMCIKQKGAELEAEGLALIAIGSITKLIQREQ